MHRLTLLLIGCAMLIPVLSGCNHVCSNRHFIELNDECKFVDENGDLIDTLSVNPGDIIVWKSTRSDTQTIKVDSDMPLGAMEVTLPSGQTVLTLVQLGSRNEFGYTVGVSPCGEGGVGGPKLKVGDDPPP